MVADGPDQRILIGSKDDGLTGVTLRRMAFSLAAELRAEGSGPVAFLSGNGPEYAVTLFASSIAGRPFLPLNYRLGDDQLGEILARQSHATVFTEDAARVARLAEHVVIRPVHLPDPESEPSFGVADVDSEDIAILLMTSGTTAAPKSAVLRHRHIASYVFESVDYLSAEPSDAVLVSVPPYHIAAIANLLSNLYAGRRIVYLDRFSPDAWLDLVRAEGVTNAMLVPTMLSRIVRELDESGQTAPACLGSVSYGGSKVDASVVESALRLMPSVDFVNAYGLTETSSTIAVLGPEDHRGVFNSPDETIRARLGSVGRPLPGVEVAIMLPDGDMADCGAVGEIFVRGPQVSGEYIEGGSRLTSDGWFPTRDNGYLDPDGYLFVLGRADDTIIRGGENIAPSEIETVLMTHPDIRDCAVAGLPDPEWGHVIGAFVVLHPGRILAEEEIQQFARKRLRGSKTPSEVIILPELPTTETGKILRRQLVEMHTLSTTA